MALSIDQLLKQHQAKLLKLDQPVCLVIKINSNTRDIFLGRGWKNQSRYSIRNGSYQYVSGNKLPSSILEKVFQ